MEWNVVITVQEAGYNKARQLLERFGEVGRTDYFNLLVLRVEDHRLFLERLREEGEQDPRILLPLASVIPVQHSFVFQTAQEFHDKARQALSLWVPALGGKSFHLRMHRRGFKGKLSSVEEERALDAYLLEALEGAGSGGSITFSDPDAIVALETLGGRAGLSLWTREDLGRYPLLHLD